MSVLRLLLREIQHRKLNFLLGLLAIVAAVALFVAVQTLSDASQRETVRLMRDLGFNVLILPKDASMAEFWSKDFAQAEMPEQYVQRLADSKLVAVQHVVARLQKRYEWRGRQILLTGVLPEVPRTHMARKPPMGLKIPHGKVYVGYALAHALDLKAGAKIELGDQEFTVERTLPEKGSKDDIRIYGHLHDIQKVLGTPGRINEIEALSCRCIGPALPNIRAELAKVLPDTQAIEFQSIAIARAETRQMMEKYAAVIIPAVLLVVAGWIGLLAFSNVMDRRHEIGVLRAVGVGSVRIALLFLGKALLLGVVGALLGYAIGTGFALEWGPSVFPVTARRLRPVYSLLVWAIVGAPLLCAVATYIPAMLAVSQDPAGALKEE